MHIHEKEYDDLDLTVKKYNNRAIVLLSSVNKASVRALRYAATICQDVTAFSVVMNDADEQKLIDNYAKLHNDIPLIVKKSLYRKVVTPLIEYIESTEYHYRKGDMITVVMPQFLVKKRWQSILHNQTQMFIQRKLIKKYHIAIVTIPFQLHDERDVLEQKNAVNEKDKKQQ